MDSGQSDDELAATIRGLLEGDRVRIVAEDARMEAVVDDKETREGAGPGSGEGVEVVFLPDSPDADADRYRITVEPAVDGGVEVGDLVGDVYDEDALEYTLESCGSITRLVRTTADA